MFNCSFLVVNGSVKMRLRLVKFTDFRKIVSRINPIKKNELYGRIWFLLSRISEYFLNLAYAAFIEVPKQVIFLCLNIQKSVFLLPFRCLNKIYETSLKPRMSYFLNIFKVQTPERLTPVEILTGERSPSPETIIAACREVRCSTIRSINRNVSNSQLSHYRRQLEKWRLENEKKTEEIYKIGLEEKELMKSVASALRYLKLLKNKREKMHANYNQRITNMIYTGTVTAEKLLSMKNSINSVDAAIIEKKNACLNLLSQGQLMDDELLDSVAFRMSGKNHTQNDAMQDSIPPVETMKKALNLVTEENTFLRGQLACTRDKIEEILKLSENINKEIVILGDKFTMLVSLKNEMLGLQHKLDDERQLLKTVEADRDNMRDKLQTLESMIKEEEEFLGDSAFESNSEDTDYLSFADGLADLDELSASSS